MTKLASTTVGVTAQSSISFTNIPQGYTDLVIKVSGRTAAAQGVAELSFNSVTTNLSSRIIFAIGSGSAGSASYASQIRAGYIIGTDYTTSTFSNNEIYIANYSSNTFKSISIDSVTETNATEAYSSLNAGLWSNPSPITSLTFTVLNNNNGVASTFTQHSTFTLYGIKNAIQTAGNSIKATGGDVIFDGTYVYHVFDSSGTFTPTQPILADYLVVAGGGGGGGNKGGGGGAGGLRSFSFQALNPGNSYTATVGSGGTGSAATNGPGGNGSDSIFILNTSTGGGGGGGGDAGGGTNINGRNGGSGGGSAQNGTGTPSVGLGNTPSTSPSPGNNGGAVDIPTTLQPGGGGGAGAVGASGVPGATQSYGGVGSSAFSAWCTATGIGQLVSGTYYLSGGGGGGSGEIARNPLGGFGGGGTGGSRNESPSFIDNATAGLANTGGGGGGGSTGASAIAGKAGGSGIIVVRYKG
jgi:hypothetical protein